MKKNKISLFVAIAFIIFVIALFTVKIIHKVDNTNENTTTNVVETNNVIENTTEEESIENVIQDNSDNKVEENIVQEEKPTTNKTENNNKVVENKKEPVKEEKQEQINVTSTFDENAFSNGHLENYPAFGDSYGTLIINKIGVNAPIIFGANEETILKGVGHDSGSYFPGECGSIIMCEHNYMNNFSRLGELKNGDIIEVKTGYGDFYYKKYDEQIVMETEYGKLPIQENKEIIMIYTCYPFKGTDRTQYRYVVYAEKI